MSKKSKLKRARNEAIAATFLYAGSGRGMRDICDESGFHRIRRLFQEAINEGNDIQFHRGFLRYLNTELCPGLAEEASGALTGEVLETLDNLLNPANKEGIAKIKADMMRLGAIVPKGFKEPDPKLCRPLRPRSQRCRR